MNDLLQAVVKRRVKALVQKERAELMGKYDTPPTYDNPLGGMPAETLANIHEMLLQYEKNVTDAVDKEVFQRMLICVEDCCGYNDL